MSYSTTCSTKILTLAIAPFLFISAGVLCEFVNGAKCVHFTVPSGKNGALFHLRGQMYAFSSTFIKKI